MNELFGIKIPQDPWVVVPCIILATAFCAYLVNIALLSVVRPIVRQTRFDIDDRVYQQVEGFLFPLLILGGLLVIEDAVPLPLKWLHAAHGVLIVCALLLATVLATKATLLFFRSIESRYESMRNIRQPVEVFTRLRFLWSAGLWSSIIWAFPLRRW